MISSGTRTIRTGSKQPVHSRKAPGESRGPIPYIRRIQMVDPEWNTKFHMPDDEEEEEEEEEEKYPNLF